MSVQMTCPFCKREFPFDNGELDKEISKIGQRISEINRELACIKAMPRKARNAKEGRRKVLVLENADLTLKISELKTIRKATDQQLKHFEHTLFCQIVKERYGEAEFSKILELVEKEMQAYRISGLMRHEYTRSPHKANITSINKL